MSPSAQKRNAYLHALGIQSWSLRAPIGKKQLIKNTAATAAPPIRPKETEMPSIKNKAAADGMLSTPASAPAKTVADTARFNLLFLVFADLLIISELPLQQRTLTSEQLRLLKAMRLSLGYVPAEPSQSIMMAWPLTTNSKIDQGEAAAYQAVQAQLKKQLEKYQCRYVVLMGVAACRYVLDADTSFDSVRGQLIANEQICAAVTYSVNELLKIPALKSVAWRDLQVVRQPSK
jgi:DNA polymerase III psi subunit